MARSALMATPPVSVRRLRMTPATTVVGLATRPRTTAVLHTAVDRHMSCKAEEQVATLFLVHGCIKMQQDTGEGVKGLSFPLFGLASSFELHLDEPRAHTFLSKGAADDKIDGWYLNTGVAHHMIGRHEGLHQVR